MTGFIVDDFAAGGGWDQGLKLADCQLPVVGVEWDKDACDTAVAAGHIRIHGDVRKRTIPMITGLRRHFGHAFGYIASPPCQTFSAAGKGAGRKHLDLLLWAVKLVARGFTPEEAVAATGDDVLDERSVLVLHPLHVIIKTRPEWILLEQVKEALPIWEAFACVLRHLGYKAEARKVHTEQYGVPQTRTRAVLMASFDHDVEWPAPTHSKYYPRNKTKRDEGVPSFITIAEALGWDQPARIVSNYSHGGRPDVRGERTGDEPAFTVTSKVDRNKVYFGDVVSGRGTIRDAATEPAPTVTASADNGNFRFVVGAGATGEGRPRDVSNEPAPTITGKGTAYLPPTREDYRPVQVAVEGDTSWVHTRPSPTIVGSFAPEVVAAPGYRKAGDPPRQKTPGSVRVTVEQAGVLQSFPIDYPWRGTKSSRYQQVGNAVPPLMAAAFYRAVTKA